MSQQANRPENLGAAMARSDSPGHAWAAFRVFFQHASPLILLGLSLACLLFRLWLDTPWRATELIAPLLILAGWPFLEWAIHVYMLHYRPVTIAGRTLDFRLPQTHRDHHASPWELSRVFIPLHVYPLVAPALLLGAWLLLPDPAFMSTALLSYFLLGLHYEWVHYLAHIRWCPPGRYYRRRVQHHRLHHFRHERLWWGVSMGLADVLFRTAPQAEQVPRSAHTDQLLAP